MSSSPSKVAYTHLNNELETKTSQRPQRSKINNDPEDEEMNICEDEEQNCSDEDDEDVHFRKWAHLTSLLSLLKREKCLKSWSSSVLSGQGQQNNKSPILKYFLNSC
jgi:hypothetical protein